MENLFCGHGRSPVDVVDQLLRCLMTSLIDPRPYFDVTEGNERELDMSLPLRGQLTVESRRPSMFLRYKDKDPNRTYLKVYPGALT